MWERNCRDGPRSFVPSRAPAVAEFAERKAVIATDIKGELVTPTGAAIIASVCEDYGSIPLMQLERSGYGAGSRSYEKFPNALRVLIGEELVSSNFEDRSSKLETLWMMETNVDDVSPQILGHVMDRAFEMGALDCTYSGAMKKNRPGVVSALPQNKRRHSHDALGETTTLGIRSYEVERRALERRV